MKVPARASRSRLDGSHVGAVVCLLGASGLYLSTLAPTVQAFDSAELTVGAYTLGFVHAPGYPLYMVLGHLFGQIPIGDIGFRLNLMSAVFGVSTVLVLYLLLLLLATAALLAEGLLGAPRPYHVPPRPRAAEISRPEPETARRVPLRSWVGRVGQRAKSLMDKSPPGPATRRRVS